MRPWTCSPRTAAAASSGSSSSASLPRTAWNGVSDGLFYGNAAQLGDQALAALAAPVYAFVATFILLKLIGCDDPLRAPEHEEALGMDVTQHGEEAYATGEGAILITAEAGADAGTGASTGTGTDVPVADPT